MQFDEVCQSALDGTKYECIFITDTLFKVTSVKGDVINLIVVAKTKKTHDSATGKVFTTSFVKWEETESLERFKRCFKQNEFVLVDEARLFQFHKI